MERINWPACPHLRSCLSAGAKRLLQDPGALFFGETAPVMEERRRLRLRVDYLCFAHMLVTPRRHVYIYDGLKREVSIASAHKAAKTSVLSFCNLSKVILLRFLASNLFRHSH